MSTKSNSIVSTQTDLMFHFRAPSLKFTYLHWTMLEFKYETTFHRRCQFSGVNTAIYILFFSMDFPVKKAPLNISFIYQVEGTDFTPV